MINGEQAYKSSGPPEKPTTWKNWAAGVAILVALAAVGYFILRNVPIC